MATARSRPHRIEVRAHLVVDEIHGQETIVHLPIELHDPRVAELEEEFARERLEHANTLNLLISERYRRLPFWRWVLGGWRHGPRSR